jgi:hypothetical protein
MSVENQTKTRVWQLSWFLCVIYFLAEIYSDEDKGEVLCTLCTEVRSEQSLQYVKNTKRQKPPKQYAKKVIIIVGYS